MSLSRICRFCIMKYLKFRDLLIIWLHLRFTCGQGKRTTNSRILSFFFLNTGIKFFFHGLCFIITKTGLFFLRRGLRSEKLEGFIFKKLFFIFI